METVGATPPSINVYEAIKDSPRFRHVLAQHNNYLQDLEKRLADILKLVSRMNEFGQNYVQTFQRLSMAVDQLVEESFPSAVTRPCLQSLSDAYANTAILNKTFHDNSCTQLYNKINSFIKNELTKVAEAKAHFDQMSNSMDEALVKNASWSRTKPSEGIEGRNALTAVSACFAHTTLDYVAQINISHAHMNHVVIDALWGLVKECALYFDQGHAFFERWTSKEDGAILDSLSTLANANKITERKMQDIHSYVNSEVVRHPSGMSPDDHVVMEGYLFKRSSNTFRTWNRRWFQIKDCKLLYSHRSPQPEEPTVMEENLMLCLVRPAPAHIDRPACFELVTPTGKSHILQADSEMQCNAWMRALQRTILHLHESTSSEKILSSNSMDVACSSSSDTRKSSEVSWCDRLRKIEGNEVCADCGAPDPKWVSINLGALLCIDCCGHHRAMGVHVSKVRSLTMDQLDRETGEMLLQLGNRVVNEIFLAHSPSEGIIPSPATPTCSKPVREAWIKAKYAEKRFVLPRTLRAKNCASMREGAKTWANHINKKTSVSRSISVENLEETTDEGSIKWRNLPEENERQNKGHAIVSCGSDSDVTRCLSPSPSPLDANSLIEAAKNGDLKSLLRAVAHRVDLNEHLEHATLLHVAVRAGQTSATEFLLLNGAKVMHVDGRLDTPLHVAAREGHTLQVCQLLKRGGGQHEKNADGKTPLQLAVDGVHADIVTLFRVHSMRDEFSEEFNNPMDETVTSVVSDITKRVATAARSAS